MRPYIIQLFQPLWKSHKDFGADHDQEAGKRPLRI
jgi:hypothetical protein